MNICPYFLSGDCGRRVLRGEADCPLAIRDLAIGEDDVELVEGHQSEPIRHPPLKIVEIVVPEKMIEAVDRVAELNGVCRSGAILSLLESAMRRGER